LTTFRRFLEDGDPTILGMEKPLVPLERQEDRRRKVRSVFFGGGTPSLAKPQVMEMILRCIDTEWGFEDGAEITMEANPTSVEVSKLREFRAAGVNRLSIGVQVYRVG